MKVKTGYQSYEEMMLDFDIFGQLISEPQIPINEYKELLYSDYKKTHLVTLEDKRYSIGDIANSDSNVYYSDVLDLGSDADEVDLLSEDDDDFSDDSYLDTESYLNVPSNEEISQFFAERQALLSDTEYSKPSDTTASEEYDDSDLAVVSQEVLGLSEELFGTVEQGSSITYEDDVFDDIEEIEDTSFDDIEEIEDTSFDDIEEIEEVEDTSFDDIEEIEEVEDTSFDDIEEEVEEVEDTVDTVPVVSAFSKGGISYGQMPDDVPVPTVLSNTKVDESKVATQIQTGTVEKKKSSKIASVEQVKSKSQPKQNVQEPTDLRDFLRKYPHSDLSFVLQYFSRKEVQKALALGRVIKKGNKLHI